MDVTYQQPLAYAVFSQEVCQKKLASCYIFAYRTSARRIGDVTVSTEMKPFMYLRVRWRL
jgi:hypothetical protein